MPELCYQHLCALTENINLGRGGVWGRGCKVKPLYSLSPAPPVCPLSLCMCVQVALPFRASSVLFSCLAPPDPHPVLLSVLSTSCLPSSRRLLLPIFSRPKPHPLLSNGKSISPFVKVALVLPRSLFSLTHSYSHTHTHNTQSHTK